MACIRSHLVSALGTHRYIPYLAQPIGEVSHSILRQLKEMGAASLVLDQRISRDGIALFEAEVMVVLVSVAGKPLRIARELRGAFTGP